MVALLSEGKYDVIISAPNRGIEMENLRPLRAELPAVWIDISNAMRGFKKHSPHMLVLDEVMGSELSNFTRQHKLKPELTMTTYGSEEWKRKRKEKEGKIPRRRELTWKR